MTEAASADNGPIRDPDVTGGPDQRQVPWWGVVSATAALVLLVLGVTAATGLQPPGFAKFSGTVSSLAGQGASDRWVMTVTFALIGACHLVTALALRPAALAGRLILAGAGVAGMLVASFPQDPGGSVTHALWSGIGFTGMAIWPVFSMRRAAASPRHPPGTAEVTTGEPVLSLEYRDAAVSRGDHGDARDRDGRRHGASGGVPWALRPAVAVRVTVLLSLLALVFAIGQLVRSPAVGTAERTTGFAQTIWPLAVVLSCRRAQQAG